MTRTDATTPTPETSRRGRPAFTLVELLVVIVIIGVLAALLLPAIVGGVRRARDARVAGEIQTIATALEQFKTRFGEYPPSRVILSESGVYSTLGTFPAPRGNDFTTTLANVPPASWHGSLKPTSFGNPDVSFGELANRSLRTLRKMFPRAILTMADQNGDGTADYWPDYNGNGVQDGTPARPQFIYLEGFECLAFFLGGVPSPTSDGKGGIAYGASGFAKDPVYPFKNAGIAASPMSTVNRNPSIFEFKGERLTDHDGDGIPGYLDPQGSGPDSRYYVYFATYGSTGYDPNDVNGADSDDPVGMIFRVGQPLFPVNNALPKTTISPPPNPYTTSLPTPVAGTAYSATQPATYQNTNSFQIISAGGDGLYGPGGQYSGSNDKLPVPPNPPYQLAPGARDREFDNITNFTQGRLN